MTKINKHQIFFIALSFVVLYVALSIQPEVLTSFNMENEKVGKIIIYSFLFFIGLIGVGHGALDGKIIWEHSKKISVKCKLYGVYILLVLLGAVLWVSSPFLGLSLLLLLSSVHFGFSDLGFLVDVALVYKICWGFTIGWCHFNCRDNIQPLNNNTKCGVHTIEFFGYIGTYKKRCRGTSRII